MIDVATDCHFQRTGKGLEDALYLVVLVLPFGTDVEVHAGGVAQALEEVEKHLGRHFTDLLALELSIPHQPGTAAEVEGHLAQTVVHRQAVAVALNAALVAKSLQQTFAESQCRVLDGVVLVDLEVALGVNGEVHHAVLAYLLEHVVEESQSGLDVTLTRAVEVHLNIDVGLLRRAPHLSGAFSGKQQFGNLGPGHAVAAQDEGLAADVAGQLLVGLTVAYNIRVLNVIRRIIHVLLDHPRAWFAGRGVVLGEVAVDELFVERDALVCQCLEDEVMNRPERVLGEGVCAEPVLVADHHEAEVQIAAYEA